MQTVTVTASLTPIDFGRSITISLPGGFQGPTLSGFNLSATSVAVFAQAGAVQSGIVLESRMKGERGRAGSNKGTPNPNKHMKPVPGRPGFGQIKDPQTGKLSGPKPWPDDPRLGPKNSNYTPLAIAVSGVVIVGAIILAPEIAIPTLIFGGGTAALAN